MRAAATSRTRSASWGIVDPRLANDDKYAIADALMSLALSMWDQESDIFEFDVEDPTTLQLLSKHRISTLVPLRCISSSQQESFRNRLATIYGSQMRIEAVAAEVLTILNQAGFDSRVLKGLASAELDYPQRRYRQTGDVDLAVRVDQFDDVVAELKAHGYRDHITVNSSFLLKGTTLDGPNGVEVDLHTRLFQRTRHASDILFRDRGTELTELPGRALCVEQRLVHAAGHFVLTPPDMRRMSGLIDITCIRQQHNPDLGLARRFASALNIEPLVGSALLLESQLAGRGKQDSDVLGTWRQPDWLDRNTRLRPERRLELDHLNRFREVQRHQWLRYLPSWLLPDERLRRKFVATLRRRRDR